MSEQRPKSRTLGIVEASNQLPGLIDEIRRGETRIVIEDAGSPVAVVVSPEDARRLVRVDEIYAERRRVLAAMREPFQDVPDEEIEREVEAAAAEVRAEMRAEREAPLSRR